MTSKFLRLFLAVAILFTISALAQTGGTAAPSTSAPAPSAAAPAAAAAPVNTGTKVGAINIEGAIFSSNEGRRDMEALAKKFEPKQTELKNLNDELEALKKQLSTTESKLNEEALGLQKKQIETKQKTFDRSVQDAQEEFNQGQQEIANRILTKLAPIVVKYAQDHEFGMILDTSKPWPQSPVLMAGQALDITQPVVEIYNTQSGVAAPAATTKPAAPKPSSTTPKAPTPSGTTPK